MKLDNILIGDHKSREDTTHHIKLVDFGFATQYVDKNGQHQPRQGIEVFRSNMIFATVNQFDFVVTSRRDDMISLVYLLVFLFNRGRVPFVAPAEFDKKQVFKYISTVKKTIKPEELIAGIDSSNNFLNFTNEILNLKYEEKPSYD